MKYAMMILAWGAGLMAATASADEVALHSGRSLVGVARQEGNRMVVETRFGTQTVPMSDVKSVTLGRTPVHEYAERVADLGPCAQASDLFKLTVWAQEQGLVRYVPGLLQQTLERDPDHAEARRLSGYVLDNGCWILRSERDEAEAAEKAARARAGAAHRNEPSARRSRPQPETVPYTLGIPRTPPPRNRSYYGGGYSIWQGVLPTNNLLNLPIIVR